MLPESKCAHKLFHRKKNHFCQLSTLPSLIYGVEFTGLCKHPLKLETWLNEFLKSLPLIKC